MIHARPGITHLTALAAFTDEGIAHVQKNNHVEIAKDIGPPHLPRKGGDARPRPHSLEAEVPTDATALPAHHGDVEETEILIHRNPRKRVLEDGVTYRVREVRLQGSVKLYEAHLHKVPMNVRESLCPTNK